MKYIRIVPDCPNCGCELIGRYKMDADKHGTGVDGWWRCENCGYESKHFGHYPQSDIVETPLVTCRNCAKYDVDGSWCDLFEANVLSTWYCGCGTKKKIVE